MVARRVLMFLLLFPRWPAHSRFHPATVRLRNRKTYLPKRCTAGADRIGQKLAHGVRPWPWTINVAGIGYRYASRDEAYQALLGFIRRYPRSESMWVSLRLIWAGTAAGFHRIGTPLTPTPICASRRGSYANATTPNREAGCRPPVVTIILRAASRPASIKRLFNAI